MKSVAEILAKLGIEQLNEMQIKAKSAIETKRDLILLSPTGTGKTLAFLLPILERIDLEIEHVQALILAPSRELAMQIEQVFRSMGAGIKVNVVYGGRPMTQDKLDLKLLPQVLIGTPGRVADHLRRETFLPDYVEMLVLDEFDKSLEIGFEQEMKFIVDQLSEIKQRILTSATSIDHIPDFARLNDPIELNFSQANNKKLEVKVVETNDKDKLSGLLDLLKHLEPHSGIIFCNFKDSIQRVSDFLLEHGIAHGCFYGGLEQKDRETALIKFRNGTHRLLLATDLAARGIDVDEIKYIIHYHLPLKEEEFVHRNGRTARMHREGAAYVLVWNGENLPEFIASLKSEKIEARKLPVSLISASENWETIRITGGRRDKISKGDVAGFLLKQGGLSQDQLGLIELKPESTYVAVHAKAARLLIQKIDNTKLKTKKVRVFLC